MSPMRTSAAPGRFVWAAFTALFLAMRVLISTGYMPEVERSHLTVILCPDGEWTAPASSMPGMDGGRGGSKAAHHQQCSYAAAAAMPFASGDSAPLPGLLILTFSVVILFAPPDIARSCRFERPYTRGPPLPA